MGVLYLVSTPIGNLGDITYRAVKALKACQIIVCEDKRTVAKLLKRYEIGEKNLRVLNEFNESYFVYSVVEEIADGNEVCMVSDAGTPGVSDPGYLVVNACIGRGIRIVSIPGASAVLTALNSSGLPSNDFRFIGFLSKKKVAKERVFREIKSSNYSGTVIFFESPKRLIATLQIMKKALGEVAVVVSRELTKKNEEIFRGTPTSAIESFNDVKGEVTVIFNLKHRWPFQL